MGRVQISVEVCDIGGLDEKDKPVRKYRLAAPGAGIRTHTLCSDHAELLETFLALVGATSQPRGRGRRVPVATLDEVAAAKRAVKKATRARTTAK